MATSNHELVRRAIKAYNDRDVEGALAVCHPDVVWKPLGATAVDGARYEGTDGVVRYFKDNRAIWETMRVEVDELRGEGDSIVLTGRIRARGRGSQADVETPTAMLIKVRDGLIIRCETYRSLDELPE